MSKEAMKLALEALEVSTDWDMNATGKQAQSMKAITVLRRALAEQPAQQEPVAIVSGYYGGQCVILPIDPARIYNSNTPLYTAPQPCPTCEALARTVMLDQTSHDTTPPQRPWQGLTDEERNKLWREVIGWGDLSHDDEDLMKAIEANLREKNA